MSHLLQLLFLFLLLANLKAESFLFEEASCQEIYFYLGNGIVNNYLLSNRAVVVSGFWKFPEQNLSWIVKTGLLVYRNLKKYSLLSSSLLTGIVWLQNQICLLQINQPGEYKYSNITVTDQASASQIYLKIDSLELGRETTNFVWINFVWINFVWINVFLVGIIEFFVFIVSKTRKIHHISNSLKLRDELQTIGNTQNSLNCVSSLDSEEDAKQLLTFCAQIGRGIQFESIYFGFHPDELHDSLKNMSFNIRAGQTIVIVGARGSEQATVIYLLTRFHQNSGRIVTDGYGVYQFSLEFLRKQVGVVLQEFFLFLGTILNSITFYNCEVTLEPIIVASKHPCLKQRLFLGDYTLLQKIKIIIPREKLQKSKIPRSLIINSSIVLISDEGNSSLDADSVCQLKQYLFCVAHLSLFDTNSTSTNFYLTSTRYLPIP